MRRATWWLVLTLGWAGGAAAQDKPVTGTVMGKVIDALGDPVPLAEVWATRWPDAITKLATAKTDGSGAFLLRNLPLGRQWLTVCARAAGMTLGKAFPRVTKDRLTEVAVIRLWDIGTISGRVLGPDDKPVAGAVVCAAYDGARLFGFEPASEAFTDADGGFTLDGVPLGWIQVRAWAKGHVLSSENLWLRGEATCTLRMKPGDGVRLAVQVDGLPAEVVATVQVIAYEDGSSMVLPSILTRGSTQGGVWQTQGLHDLEYLVRTEADGFVIAPDEIRVQPGSKDHALRFRAAKLGSITLSGTLRDTNQRALAGETIVVRSASGVRESTAVTDAGGKFQLSSPLAADTKATAFLRRSDFVLAQKKTEGQFGLWDWRFLVYHEFVVMDGGTLELIAQKAASVEGQVVDEEGTPVAFHQVDLQHRAPNPTPAWTSFWWSSNTDRDGRFQLRGLHPPQGDIRVSTGDNEEGVSEAFQLAAGEIKRGMKIVVRPKAMVEGIVRGADGKPVPGARVWLRNCDEFGRQTDGSVYEVLADRSGRYRHVDVAPGWHVLQLQLDGAPKDAAAQRAPTEPFDAKPGKTVTQNLSGGFGG